MNTRREITATAILNVGTGAKAEENCASNVVRGQSIDLHQHGRSHLHSSEASDRSLSDWYNALPDYTKRRWLHLAHMGIFMADVLSGRKTWESRPFRRHVYAMVRVGDLLCMQQSPLSPAYWYEVNALRVFSKYSQAFQSLQGDAHNLLYPAGTGLSAAEVERSFYKVLQNSWNRTFEPSDWLRYFTTGERERVVCWKLRALPPMVKLPTSLTLLTSARQLARLDTSRHLARSSLKSSESNWGAFARHMLRRVEAATCLQRRFRKALCTRDFSKRQHARLLWGRFLFEFRARKFRAADV